jgi:hypothetical protein
MVGYARFRLADAHLGERIDTCHHHSGYNIATRR